MSFGSDHKGGGSPTESEDAIRHLKASQSVDAAFQAAGFPSPPGDIAALVTNHVKSAVKGLPISQVANMSPGSGVLAAAALAGVDLFVSSLTPTQREAVKNGINPLDPAAMLKLTGALSQLSAGNPGAGDHARGDGRASNGTARGPSEGSGRVSDAALSKIDVGAFNPKNYGGSIFEQKGLSFSTFASLRAEKFDAKNIVHAAEDAKQHGFDPNNKQIAKDFAIFDQDDAQRREERNKLLAQFQAGMDGDDEMKRLKAAYDNEADPEKKAAIAEQYHARGKQISRDSGFRGHVDTMPTARAKKAGDDIEYKAIEQKLKGHISDLSHGDEAKAEQAARAVWDYRRNPQDAAARQNYDELKRQAQSDPLGRRAIAGIERGVAQDGKLKAVVVARNESKSKAADDLFASMTRQPSVASKGANTDGKPAEIKAASVEPQKPNADKPAQKVRVAGAPTLTA